MNEMKKIRQPRQKRSAATRERILDAALRLFCRDGYYQTTTNAIAKEAGVPIGSLYSYFADKDALFFAVLEDYNRMFVDANEAIMASEDLYRRDQRAWLRALIESLVDLHERSRDLNRELKILSFSRPDIAALRERNDAAVRGIALEFFRKNRDELGFDDLETVASVSFTFISAIVDYLVFENPRADRARVIDVAAEGLYRSLKK